MNATSDDFSTLAYELTQVWAVWWREVDSFPLDMGRVARLLVRLRRFSPSFQEDEVERRVKFLSQGKYLLKAALTWHKPMIGPGNHQNVTDRARGEQWRLVLAYAGLERIIKLLQKAEAERGLKKEKLECFISNCQPPSYNPPLIRLNGQNSIASSTALNCLRNPVREFLDGKTITSWVDAVCLAQGLRNATTHGSLAPVRVKEAGLRAVFSRLTADIGRLGITAIHRLATEESPLSLS